MQRRMRDSRPGFNFTQTEPVAGNYFPVSTALFIRDARSQLTVLTDRAQGGSGSVRDGELELMVHRRLVDYTGEMPKKVLNETAAWHPSPTASNPGYGYSVGGGLVVRGTHLVLFGRPEEAARAWRRAQDGLFFRPVLGFTPEIPVHSRRAGMAPLPENVAVLTLESRSAGTGLLRLGHQFAVGSVVA